MKKNTKSKQQNKQFIFEELEARQLFSGGIEGLIDTDLESSVVATYIEENTDIESPAQVSEESDVSAAEQQSLEIVFVDTGVENYQTLVNDLFSNADSSRNIEVVLLDSVQNGIEKISTTLQDRDDLDAIHIISHGSDGNVQLGNTLLNADALEENNLQIALWANAFDKAGDILISTLR